MYKSWTLAHGRTIDLGPAPVLMGILNVTPDSFSDGGRFVTLEAALMHARRMVDEGAAIVDVGGESSRPGAEPVSPQEELDRILPAIEALARHVDVAISVDTWRASTAQAAIDAGAHVVNDIWGFQRDPDLAATVARQKAGAVLMHNGRDRYRLPDLIADQNAFLARSVEIARGAGVADDRIVLDPGFGFAKDAADNLELAARFSELAALGFPLVAGTSRKRFLGHVTGRADGAPRDVATAASSVMLRLAGADIFRVHNVAINRDALAVADAIVAAQRKA